ncbi:hypothetical protein [Ectothiorhodospira variabilis]|uniref:hypothetical protein n=1 Tax=Ectothiorhodospira variabilis TaxID=505694 RepID=UPI001EFB3F1F|nr:hypothetical protein [Ectothiorhodospira variabilis]MCG5494942.1 hypothetical protein [Ectothiorhodospira variabilis]MCG5504455.1 hypothetical protein [Ectothiorhodospira variabilis]MCG5507679.1 hypothetical protein [Ectothiorhodospira variabilis]
MTLAFNPDHIRLCTATGSDPMALWAAASTPLCMEQRLTHPAALASPGGRHQVLRGVPAMGGQQDTLGRVQALLRGALGQQPLPAQALVLWPYRPTLLEHSRLHPRVLWAWMGKEGLRHPEARLQPVCLHESAVTLLDHAEEALSHHPDRALFLGGADSLLDPDTLLALVDQQMPLAWDGEDGIVPGEAAAFLPLRDGDDGVRIPGWDSCPAPAARPDSTESHSALAQALSSALTQAGLEASSLDGILLPPGNGAEGDREWWNCQVHLWPLRADIPEGVSLPREPDEDPLPPEPITPPSLDSGAATGHAGAIQWLLQLALAGIWMRDTGAIARSGAWPRVAATAVLDRPMVDERGAVILSAGTGQEA